MKAHPLSTALLLLALCLTPTLLPASQLPAAHASRFDPTILLPYSPTFARAISPSELANSDVTQVAITDAGFVPVEAHAAAGAPVRWVNNTSRSQTLIGGEPQHLYLPLLRRGPGNSSAVAAQVERPAEATSLAETMPHPLFRVSIAPGEVFT
jgi:hypothetical protein